MESNGFSLQLISQRQDRLETRIQGVEQELDQVPELRKEVSLMIEEFRRTRQAVAAATTMVVGAAVVSLLFQQGIL